MADQLIQLCSLSSGWPLTCTLVACTGCKPVNQRGLQSAWLLISNETEWSILSFSFSNISSSIHYFHFLKMSGVDERPVNCDFEIIVVVENQTELTDPDNQTQPPDKEETRKKRAVQPRVTHIILSNSFLDVYVTEWFRLANLRKSRKRHNGRSHLEQVRGRFSVCY